MNARSGKSKGRAKAGTSASAGGFGGARQMNVRLKTAGKRTLSSQRWLERQLNDPYVAAARRDGWRSRAAFKLIEIDDKHRILKPGQRVVDLGAAPGGWAQVAALRVKADNRPAVGGEVLPKAGGEVLPKAGGEILPKAGGEILPKAGGEILPKAGGQVVAIDYLDLEPIPGVEIVKLDFLDDSAPARLASLLRGGSADVVLSDMAAPTVGHTATDHLRIMALAEAALAFAVEVLSPGGAFLCKVFQGGSERELLDELKRRFKVVRHVKPPASRADSAELYVLATGFRGR